MWGTGESNRRSDFTTAAKVCEQVRKLVCLLRESEEGRRLQEHVVDPSLIEDVSLAEGRDQGLFVPVTA